MSSQNFTNFTGYAEWVAGLGSASSPNADISSYGGLSSAIGLSVGALGKLWKRLGGWPPLSFAMFTRWSDEPAFGYIYNWYPYSQALPSVGFTNMWTIEAIILPELNVTLMNQGRTIIQSIDVSNLDGAQAIGTARTLGTMFWMTP